MWMNICYPLVNAPISHFIFVVILILAARPAFLKDGAIYCNQLRGAPRDGDKEKTSRVRSFSHRRRLRQVEQLDVTNLSGPDKS